MPSVKQLELAKLNHCKNTLHLFQQSRSAHAGHPVGTAASFCQRINRIVLNKISELVSSGIDETKEVQRALNHYVKYTLPKNTIQSFRQRTGHRIYVIRIYLHVLFIRICTKQSAKLMPRLQRRITAALPQLRCDICMASTTNIKFSSYRIERSH